MNDSHFAATPEPPYYAVIFTARRMPGDNGYDAMAERMAELAARQPGYLGMEQLRDSNGFGITISYWSSLEAIAAWKAHPLHRLAQERGKRLWYERYEIRIAKVERAYRKEPPAWAAGSDAD